MTMSTLTPADARQQIIKIIDDSVQQALRLKASLVHERQALEDRDLDAIEQSLDNKNACVAALHDLDQRRDTLCQSLGFPSGDEQMTALIAWCDEGNLVDNRWLDLMSIAAQSSDLNMTNGAIVRIRQHHFESSLSVLRGIVPGSDTHTYSRSGAESGDYGRRSLAEA